MTFTVELEREEDGRWIAEISGLSGVLCYGQDRDEAVAGVQALRSALLPSASRAGRRPQSSSTHVPSGVNYLWR